MSELETHYLRIGGEPAVKHLVKTFYQIMSETPQTKHVRDMHPVDIASSEEKLTLFLTGWLGGPDLYIEKYGHPRLRQRHMPFSIGLEERDQWLYCMAHALATLELDDLLAQQLMASFAKTADFMRNREETVTPA
ncbi:MAG: group II truncated hemoglobin [Piscirickettsiaceae bacterium]|jgi:hemoglobin|nr:group II truncated hemoglobin [Piscirickettsiaceae bacterium]